MAKNGKGDKIDPENIHANEKNQSATIRRPEAIPSRKKKTQHTTTLAVKHIKGLHTPTPRRTRHIDTHRTKINYIKRLEDLWRQIYPSSAIQLWMKCTGSDVSTAYAVPPDHLRNKGIDKLF